MSGEYETRTIRVVDGDTEGRWTVTWIDPAYGDDFVLTLAAPDDRTWSAQGWNMFEALLNLRRQTDKANLKLCCQGARTQAAISGMAADMGRGRLVYRIRRGQVVSRRDLVDVFDPAPADEIGTVEEQAAYKEQWLGGGLPLWRPRNLANLLRYGTPLAGPLTQLSNWWSFRRTRRGGLRD